MTPPSDNAAAPVWIQAIKAIAELLGVLLWPVLVGVVLIVYRETISTFLQTIIRHGKKFSAAGISVELETEIVKAVLNEEKNKVLESPLSDDQKIAKLKSIRNDERRLIEDLNEWDVKEQRLLAREYGKTEIVRRRRDLEVIRVQKARIEGELEMLGNLEQVLTNRASRLPD